MPILDVVGLLVVIVTYGAIAGILCGCAVIALIRWLDKRG